MSRARLTHDLRPMWIAAAALALAAVVLPASAASAVDIADLSVTKVLNGANPDVGGTATFTVTLSNAGPSGATGVVVKDQLAAGLAFVSATPSQGSYNSATGDWSVGSVASGGSATLTITATRSSGGILTNTAIVTVSDQADPDTSDNIDTVILPAGLADLAVTKTVDNVNATVGQQVQFTVTLGNDGPFAAGGVAVTDQLPVGLTFVSATPSQGTYSSVSGLWTVGAMATGSTATLQIVALRAASSLLVNTAAITFSDHPDPDPGDNTAVASLSPVGGAVADLEISKVVDKPTASPGEQVTFTVTLANDGPDPATVVAVADPLPPSFTFISATPSQGTYDSATGLWSVGSLATGATATLAIVGQVTGSGVLTNTATATGAEADPDPSDNTASATVTIATAVATPSPGGGLAGTGPGMGGLITTGVVLMAVGGAVLAALTLRRRRSGSSSSA